MGAPLGLFALMECRPEAAFAHRAYGATLAIRPLTWLSGSLTCVKAGLCDSCAHQKIVNERARQRVLDVPPAPTDDRFPKYPRLPVERCPGYEREGLSESR